MSIEQVYDFNAPVSKVWQALTDATTMEQWGAGPAIMNAYEGGEWSLWGGDIHGTNTKVVPEKLLEQTWYGHDHPEREFIARFAFIANGSHSTVELSFTGNIEDEQKDVADWRDYYFDPIKKLVEQG